MTLTDSLRAALAQPKDDGFTVQELVTEAGLPLSKYTREKIRAFLKIEIASGRVQSRMGRRAGIAGLVAVPVYVPVKKKRWRRHAGRVHRGAVRFHLGTPRERRP